ncbi:hypothetical protein GCM10027052_24820 [Parafrigoribacterium mesophilum]
MRQVTVHEHQERPAGALAFRGGPAHGILVDLHRGVSDLSALSAFLVGPKSCATLITVAVVRRPANQRDAADGRRVTTAMGNNGA